VGVAEPIGLMTLCRDAAFDRGDAAIAISTGRKRGFRFGASDCSSLPPLGGECYGEENGKMKPRVRSM
jgi:hypothetical protein